MSIPLQSSLSADLISDRRGLGYLRSAFAHNPRMLYGLLIFCIEA
jgi:hypothetical protein